MTPLEEIYERQWRQMLANFPAWRAHFEAVVEAGPTEKLREQFALPLLACQFLRWVLS